jgi:CBS domain-containing protein
MKPTSPNPAAEALAAATLAFLRQHPPFNGMEDNALRYAAPRFSLAYFPKDTPVFTPAHGKPRHFHVIQRGVVQRADGDPAGGAPATVLRAGECFPIGQLLEKDPGLSSYIAAADTFCYQLPADDFDELLRRSPRFHEFATRHLASMLRESRRLLATRTVSLAWEQQAMSRPLRSLVRREPVVCAPETPIGEALRVMSAARVGSVLIVGAGGVLAGILTRHDVVDRVALAGRSPGDPVSTVMTPRPRFLPAEASAHDAALLIAREGIRHVPVVDGGRLIGVVTERDLFALQHVSARGINRLMAEARDTATLKQAAGAIRELARDLLAQGLAAEQLTLIISTLNDELTRRIIALESARHRLDGIEWCWLAFGSEGRYEQTISTDQDNGIVFAAGAQPMAEQTRARLLPLAQAINKTLDACGFPLCKGNIMAGNPRCCLSLDEWRQRFADSIEHPAEQRLLDAVIFFDFRPLYGTEALADALRARLLETAPARPAFLRQLAQHALEARPPLGLLSDFDIEDAPGAPGTIDLKKSGARLYVDAGRVLALAAAVSHTNTAERLRQAGHKLGMSTEEIAAATEGFYFIQTLRLREQLLGERAGGDPPSPNRLDPERLNEVDRRILKESFRQAGKLQSRLALDYQL